MQIPRKMSAQNVMASISRTLGGRQEIRPANEVKLAGEESKDRLYEPKDKQKAIRVLTVVAYIISVSTAAIVLSLYYMYIWDPSDPQLKLLRLNQSLIAAPTKPPCVEITPMVLPLADDRGMAYDNGEKVESPSRSLYDVLTTPTNSQLLDYPPTSSTDVPAVAFNPNRNDDDYNGEAVTIEPVEDFLDD